MSAWLLLLAAELALLYTHNSAPVAVLWLNAITLLAWGVARSLRRPDWRGWFAGQIAVFLLWSPYLFTRFLAVGGAEGVLIRRPQLSLDLLAQIWGSYWTAPWALVGRETLLVAGSVAVLILAVLVIAWRSAIAGWLVIHVTLLTGLLLIALSALGNELHGRYLVMIAPLLVTLIGAGVGGLRWPVARLGAILLIAALGLANIHYAQNPLYGHDDARAMATYYAETLDENDSVLMWSYADRYELAYYWGGWACGRVASCCPKARTQI